MAATFTFDPGTPATSADLAALYEHLLGAKPWKPTVSLGAVSRETAEAWLDAGHALHIRGVGKRSLLMQHMDICSRVELVDLV